MKLDETIKHYEEAAEKQENNEMDLVYTSNR